MEEDHASQAIISQVDKEEMIKDSEGQSSGTLTSNDDFEKKLITLLKQFKPGGIKT